MKMNKMSKLTAGVGLFVCAPLTLAVEPQPIKYGDFDAFISFDSSLEHNDNIFRASSGERDSAVARIAPHIKLLNQNASRSLSIEYHADLVHIFESEKDGYSAQELELEFASTVAKQQTLGFGASYTDGREARGVGSSEGAFLPQIDGVTRFDDYGVRAFYTYGDDQGPFSVDAQVSYNDLRFRNFRTFTRQRDYRAVGLDTEFDYKLSVATSFFVDLSVKDFDYSNGAPGFNDTQLDNLETSAHVGLAWSATRNTTGRASVGFTNKELEFIDAEQSFASWNLAVDWEPSSTDIVSIETLRQTREPTGTGLFLIDTSYQISWDHEISRYLSFDVYYNNTNSDFESFAREDDTNIVGFELSYDIQRTVALGFSLFREDKDSSLDTFDLEQGIVKASITVVL